MDNLQVPEKELRCEACGRVIKPERDEKVERVTDEDSVVRVFCELDLCRQERLEVHIRAFNARIAPERAAMATPPKPMVRICEACGWEIKVEISCWANAVATLDSFRTMDEGIAPWAEAGLT
jgi:RNase P subunit RPR2